MHPTQVITDLRAYQHNVQTIHRRLNGRCRLCAVVKADAYGHGIGLIAPAALHAGADTLAIVDNWEAQAIRDLGIDQPVIRLRPALREEAEEALRQGWHIEEAAGSLQAAQMLNDLGERFGVRVSVHMKLDVGMGRMGFCGEDWLAQVQTACQLPHIHVAGVMTHFPCADDDLPVTESQLNQFEDKVKQIAPYVPRDAVIHTANSAAADRIPSSHLGMVRAGILSYGLQPGPDYALPDALHPVMSWETRIALLREVPPGTTVGYGMTYRLEQGGRIATLPMGYADAFLRAFSNRAPVLVRGQRCMVAGRVSMDMVTLDVSHLPNVQEGDAVTLVGRQGEEEIRMAEYSALADTIDYELACLIGNSNPNRVARLAD